MRNLKCLTKTFFFTTAITMGTSWMITSCGDASEDDEEKIDASCLTTEMESGVDMSYCVDLENITATLAEAACTDSYKGTYTQGTLCSIPTGTEGCASTDAESEIKTTIWFSGADWPKGTSASSSLCENGEAVTK